MDRYRQDRTPGEPGGRTVIMTPEFKADAHRQYARLRAKGPVHPAQFFPASRAGWSSTTTWPARR
ncbi:hypothetical protein [Streptomyces olivaceoviridis]|uniref:hypothetical protein n=1 Tax=Streptomyces olivaceoviridis TaxID=1921 RepID=UPI003702E426